MTVFPLGRAGAHDRTCSVDGCASPHRARGLCSRHYQRAAKHGSAELPTLADKFWAKVTKTSTCWLWTGATNGAPGYGIFRGGATRDARGSRRWVLAHRFAYELLVGPIPDGFELDHRCRTRRCVRPDHLEAVTHRENTLRSQGPSARAARRNSCARGHPYTTSNLHRSGGKRRCRTCDRAKEARRIR